MHIRDEKYYSELKQRLMKYMMDNPMSKRQLGIEIGVCAQTMDDFLHYDRDTTRKVLLKIEKYLRQRGM